MFASNESRCIVHHGVTRKSATIPANFAIRSARRWCSANIRFEVPSDYAANGALLPPIRKSRDSSEASTTAERVRCVLWVVTFKGASGSKASAFQN